MQAHTCLCEYVFIHAYTYIVYICVTNSTFIYLKLVSTHAEATAEVLPRLYKIKYESGTVEELLYVDMPREYQNSSGQIVLDYAKAIQESVFENLRVVRDGQLRLVFSLDLKVIQHI